MNGADLFLSDITVVVESVPVVSHFAVRPSVFVMMMTEINLIGIAIFIVIPSTIVIAVMGIEPNFCRESWELPGSDAKCDEREKRDLFFHENT
jgi:hypothetical protein